MTTPNTEKDKTDYEKAITTLCKCAATLARGFEHISDSPDDIPKFMPKGTPKKVLRMIGQESERIHAIGRQLADVYHVLKKLPQENAALRKEVEELKRSGNMFCKNCKGIIYSFKCPHCGFNNETVAY